MARAVTQEEAVRRIREALGDKYDLSKVEYVDSRSKITVICSKHGEFQKPVASLWKGSGCETCRHDKKVLPVEEWVQRFRTVHGDRYDYSLITDLRHPKMAIIICPDHGEFQKQPHNHWTGGAGCPTCSKAILTPQSNRYSREEWIKRFRKAQGDRYDYRKFEVLPERGKATFICPDHGEFLQRQDAHADGRIGCDGCKKQQAESNFFKEARELFDDRFDYSKFEYVSAKTKSVIICPDHGEFMQNPDKHLHAKYPCPHCLSKGRQRVKKAKPKLPCPTRSSFLRKAKAKQPKGKSYPRVGVDDYLKRLNLPDGYKADLTEYKSLLRGPVSVTCPAHGVFTHDDPRSFLVRSHACPTCARENNIGKGKTKGYGEFVAEATVIHKGAYIYPDCPDFINRRSVVTIICPTHGEYKKKAQKHLSGQGCSPCAMDELRRSGRLPGGYSLTVFDADQELSNKLGTVYYVKVGNVYKIGITALDVRRRMSAIKSASKREVKLIKSHSCTLREAYILEQSILRTYEEFRTFRRWSTEVFSKDVLKGIEISNVPLVSSKEMDDWGLQRQQY